MFRIFSFLRLPSSSLNNLQISKVPRGIEVPSGIFLNSTDDDISKELLVSLLLEIFEDDGELIDISVKWCIVETWLGADILMKTFFFVNSEIKN
jgi:hypothetical protein